MTFPAPDLRWQATEAMQRAKNELAANSDIRLRYAALELRYAMEALTYDRGLAYVDDISPEHLRTWQARQFMTVLLQIDPTIDLVSTMAFGVQPDLHTPAPREAMRVLGTDTPLSLKNLKDHYDAIGSFLHMPGPAQVLSGAPPDLIKLRARCETVVAVLEKVLSSRIWNTTMGNYATLNACVNNDCKQPIKRRLPFDKTEIDTKCFACNADYKIKYGSSDNHVEWIPQQEGVKCANGDCSGTTYLWRHKLRPGTWWTCHECGVANGIFLSAGVIERPEQNEGTSG